MPIDNLLFKKHNQQLAVQKADAAPQAESPTSIPLPETTAELAAIQTTDVVVPEVPVDQKNRVFKDKLDALDALIAKDNGISTFTIDDIRGYVKEIMITLHTEPELDAIIIDRDVHNIMRFIRYVKDQAFSSNVEAGEKRVARVKKAAAVNKNQAAFDALHAGGLKLGALQLPDLSALNQLKK